MTGLTITILVFTVLMIWILLLSYKYAYKRHWGNENKSVDPLPNENEPSQHKERPKLVNH